MSWHSGYDLTDEQVCNLAQQVARYDLEALLSKYNWQGSDLSAAWAQRMRLEQQARAIQTSKVLDLAGEIHRWGFRGDIPRSVRENPDFLPALRKLFTEWKCDVSLDERKEAKIGSLAKLLMIRQLGIAKISKWICFNDQTRYAIYDSRVSLALRDVAVDGKRVFPIVSRQAFAGLLPWYSDAAAGSAWKMAHYYWNYLRVINHVAERIRHWSDNRTLYAAEVEMALFMLGDVWPNPETRLPLYRMSGIQRKE